MREGRGFINATPRPLYPRVKELVPIVEEGHAAAQLVEALLYNPERCGFDSR
jgi:hypothetical protein